MGDGAGGAGADAPAVWGAAVKQVRALAGRAGPVPAAAFGPGGLPVATGFWDGARGGSCGAGATPADPSPK